MRARVMWTLAVWGFCASASVALARGSALGPTVYVLDHEHGIHVGDVVGCFAFAGLAAWVSRSLWRAVPQD